MELPERRYLGRQLDKYYDDAATRSKYHEYLKERRSHFGLPKERFYREERENMIREVKSSSISLKYEVIQQNGVDTLVLKRPYKLSSTSAYLRQVMAEEDSYNILAKIHRKVNHLDYKFMFKELKPLWTFPIGYVRVLVTSCNVCRMIRNMRIIKREDIMETRREWRVKLLDMKIELSYLETPKYVLLCEDVQSEFVILRPLNDKNVDTLADQLMKLFINFGAPLKLTAAQSLKEEYFEPATKIILETQPQFVVCTESDEGSETVVQNHSIIDALTNWIEEVEDSNYEIDCEVGCHVVQARLNNKLRVIYAREEDKAFYQAFVPQSIFMDIELDLNSLDTEAIVRVKGGDEVLEDHKTLWKVRKHNKSTLKRKRKQ